MKKKYWVIIVILLLFIPIGIYVFINAQTFTLKTDKITFEYGEELQLDLKEIVETDYPQIVEDITIDQSEIVLEDGENYPKIGESTVYLTYDGLFKMQSRSFKIFVSDTTKPDFIEAPETIRIKMNEADFDFISDFKVQDLSEYKLIIDTNSVDFEEAGKYQAQGVALDVHGNEAIHDFYIVVEEKAFEKIENSSDGSNPEETPQSEEENTTAIIPTIKNGILIVNKKHPLPANYHPGDDSTAVASLNNLISEMQRLGYDISNDYSGFRTYDYQKDLYESYVSEDGREAADNYSARPGYSEHQTGLTFNLKHYDGALVEKTAEAKWIAENAADYGFIVRYQVGKEHITGYQAETWHLRYIGREARTIYQSGLTLEEYLYVEGGDYYDN